MSNSMSNSMPDLNQITDQVHSKQHIESFVTELNALCLRYKVTLGTYVETDGSERLQSQQVVVAQTVKLPRRHPTEIDLLKCDGFPTSLDSF